MYRKHVSVERVRAFFLRTRSGATAETGPQTPPAGGPGVGKWVGMATFFRLPSKRVFDPFSGRDFYGRKKGTVERSFSVYLHAATCPNLSFLVTPGPTPGHCAET